jgi:hypothetical protein
MPGLPGQTIVAEASNASAITLYPEVGLVQYTNKKTKSTKFIPLSSIRYMEAAEQAEQAAQDATPEEAPEQKPEAPAVVVLPNPYSKRHK